MVTYQIKVLTTAAFTVLLLHRRLSIFQWLSLIVLIAGVVLVQISNKKDNPSSDNTPFINSTITTSTPFPENNSSENNPIYGFIAILIASILSGFAGIYFEKILKTTEASIWIRNIQLSFLSIPCAIVIIAIIDHEAVLKNGFMQGFDYGVWIVVFLQAIGGLIIAAVIKFADNILKVFATSISIIIGVFAQIFLFHLWPKLLFIFGAILVIVAVLVYAIFPYQNQKQKESETSENPKNEIDNCYIEKNEVDQDSESQLSHL